MQRGTLVMFKLKRDAFIMRVIRAASVEKKMILVLSRIRGEVTLLGDSF